MSSLIDVIIIDWNGDKRYSIWFWGLIFDKIKCHSIGFLWESSIKFLGYYSFDSIKIFISFGIIKWKRVIEVKFLLLSIPWYNNSGKENIIFSIYPSHLSFLSDTIHIVNDIHVHLADEAMSDVSRKRDIAESIQEEDHFMFSICFNHNMLLIFRHVEVEDVVVGWKHSNKQINNHFKRFWYLLTWSDCKCNCD